MHRETGRLRLKPEPLDKALGPFQQFVEMEASAGLVLLASTAVAIGWANSPWREAYHALWETHLTVSLGDGGGIGISESLREWINHALMAVFFFVVGLEIKREVLVGELSSPRNAALPVAAALGGMAVPALVFLAVNWGGDTRGWSIPMATDIAFAVGVLALVGRRVPLAAKVFLTAFAIADDIGATLVIALFYTEELSGVALSIAALFLGLMVVANRAGVRNTALYAVLMAGLWLSVAKSGVHPTVAGVLAAMAVPARTRVSSRDVSRPIRALLDRFDRVRASSAGGVLVSPEQRAIMEQVEHISFLGQTPLQRLEHFLHPWMSFGIMPLFALANAGVSFGGPEAGPLVGPVTWGVALGLLLGKPIGIATFAWVAVRLRLAALPAGIGWRHIVALGALGGIGFTMSLFVAGLSYGGSPTEAMAKVGILAGSALSAAVGLALLRRA